MNTGVRQIEPEDGRNYLTALARGLSVMRAFSDCGQQMTLAEVARVVDLPRATARRCLITLEALGYVQSAGRHFSLSPQVLTLARAYLSSSPVPRVAQPFLERVSDVLGESCSVSILHQTDVIYVARSTRRRMASLHRDVGTHLPAYCTSMGRVLLASLSENDLARFFAAATFEPLTPHTITTEDELRGALKKVARNGYCLVDRELEIDLLAIAIPLRNAAGRTVAALNVSTQAGRTKKKDLTDRYLTELRTIAAEMRPLLVG